MNNRRNLRRPATATAISLAVASCFSVSLHTSALANPNGFSVVNGNVTFSHNGNTLTITNTPGSIINWQNFSIGSGELTRFLQQSASSAVLNRVVGVDPSVILGALQSNGRVFLINPNGILFGQGSRVDVAGLVASTLKLSDNDFLAGKLKFMETPGAGSIVNKGGITTPNGGQIYLIAPAVENSGVITSPKGEIILAAGRSVEIVDAGTPSLRVQITAPDNEAVNLGQIVASAGKIGIYGGLIKNSGTIKADGVVVGQNGEILLKATKNVALEKGSAVTASGPTAGTISVQSDNGTVTIAGAVEANATQGKGGAIIITGQQGVSVESTGRISANGVEGGNVAIASSAGSVTIAAPVTANATTGRAGAIAANAAATLTIAAGGQLSASGGLGKGTVTAQGSGGVTIENGGSVQASGAAGGSVQVLAEQGSVLLQGSIESTGSEAEGGNVQVTARDDITLDVGSRIIAGGGLGGEVRAQSTQGTLLVSGDIDAQGSKGPGGSILLLAPRVGLLRRARLDVSGDTGGGTALIGGDYQGRNPLVPNAFRVYVDADAAIRADAITSGDGGKVIVWSDEATRFYGAISARGGAQGGNGGFVEVSGKGWLDFSGVVNTIAPLGVSGTLLLDPFNLTIQASTPDLNGEAPTGDDLASATLLFDDFAGFNSIITAGAVNTQLNSANVLLQASNDITVNAAITTATPGRSLTLHAGRQVNINAGITMTTGTVNVYANDEFAVGARSAGAGGITMAAGTTIDVGSGTVFLRVGGGAGAGQQSGDIVIANVIGQNVEVQQNGRSAGTSSVLRASPASLITARNLLIEVDHAGAVAGGTVGTSADPIRIAPQGGSVMNFESHTHQASAGIFIEAPVAGTNLVIGDVPFFGGGVNGVQTAAGGEIVIKVTGAAGTLTTNAGTATCAFLFGASGGPICAGPAGAYAPGDKVTLLADDMNIQNVVKARDVYLMPNSGGSITLGSAGAGGSLHLSQSEINQVDAFTFNIGEQGVSGNVIFAGDVTTPALFGIRTGGSITSDAFTLTVGATGDGNIDMVAQGGIQLNIKAATLSAWNTGTTGNISIAETSSGSGALVLDSGVSADALRNDATLGSITLTTTNRTIDVVNSINALVDVTLTAGSAVGSDLSITAQGAPLTVSAGRDIIVNGANFFVGDNSATYATLVQSGRDLTVNLSGTMGVRGGNATVGTDVVATATVLAGRDAYVTANELSISGGNARGGGTTANDASALFSVTGNALLTIGSGGLHVLAGTAAITPGGGGYDFTARANATLEAGGNLTASVTNAGSGALRVGGGTATAEAHSGAAVATASANSRLSAGGALSATITNGSIVVGGGTARAEAYHFASEASALTGANTATANANTTFSGGTGASITLTGGNLEVRGANAYASAYKKVNCCSGSQALSGTNNATATANVTVAATSGNLAIAVGGGTLTLGDANASAYAYHRVNSGATSTLIDDNTATARANVTLSGGNDLTIDVGAGAMLVGDNLAEANAYHETSNVSNNTMSGGNTATAAANIRLSAGNRLAITGTAASVLGVGVDGGEGYLRPHAHASAYKKTFSGTGNVLDGTNEATAQADITLSAAGAGGLDITVGGLQVQGAEVFAQGYHKTEYGNGNTLSGDNNASADSELSFNATHASGSLTIDVGSGALMVTGGRTVLASDATRTFKHVHSGQTHDLTSGNNTATAEVNVAFNANNNISITAGSMNVNQGGGAGASADKTVTGSGATFNQIGGTNTTTAAANISFSAGNDLAIDLSIGGGALIIDGARATGLAYHGVTGGGEGGTQDDNAVGGANAVTATANTSFDAGGALIINAGSVSIVGNRAQASAYKYVTGSSFATAVGNTLSGVNTGTANSTISLTGSTIALNLGVGSLSVNGSTAYAYARHFVENGNTNTLSGDHNATANSTNVFTSTGALTINAAGGMSLNGDDASAYATKRVEPGNANMLLSGDNSATANSNIDLSGSSLTLNLGTSSLTISGSDASAYARHRIYTGDGNTLGGNNSSTANSNITIAATGGALTIDAGGVQIYGSSAQASAYKVISPGNSNTLSGNNTATANRNTTMRGTSVTLALGAGAFNGDGGEGLAYAHHEVFNGGFNSLSGNHSATANSNLSLTATGGPLTVNAGSMSINARSADVDAHKKVSSGSDNTISGDDTVTAHANIVISGPSIAIDVRGGGSGVFAVNGSSADARAIHRVQGSGAALRNILSGDNVATADNSITLTTAGTLTIDAASLALNVDDAQATARLFVTGSDNTVGVAGPATSTATANANISFSATGGNLSINVGSGSLTLGGSEASALAHHSAVGNGNTLSGAASATAGNQISITTANALNVTAHGGVFITGNNATASAYKRVSGNSNTLTGNNSANVNKNIILSGASVILDLGAGALVVSGGSGSGSALARTNASHQVVSGNSNIVGGDNSATADNSIKVRAVSGTLTVNAGSGVYLSQKRTASSSGSSSSSSGAAKLVSAGDNNTLSGGNIELATSNIKLEGNGIALNLAASGLAVEAASAQAIAYLQVSGGTGNILSGDQSKTVDRDITINANSGALTVDAGGGVTIDGGNADAQAYNLVYTDANTLSGNNTATASTNITLRGGTVALNLAAGNLNVQGAAANARAYGSVGGIGNTVSGNQVSTANSNITVAATGGALTVTAGAVNILGNDAYAQAYKSAYSGGDHTLAGNNTASAYGNITLAASGGLTISASGTITLGNSSSYYSSNGARAYAYHSVSGAGGNNVSGVHTATAASGISLTAGGAATINAAAMSLQGDGGEGGTTARAYMEALGTSSNIIGGAAGVASNTATATGGIAISGNGMAINLGSGSLNALTIRGGSASAEAYHKASYTGANNLSGANAATATSNIGLSAGGGALTITAGGGIAINGGDGNATAYHRVYGSASNVAHNNNALAGTNTALTNSNISLSGNTVLLELGGGSLDIYGRSANAYAYHSLSNVAGSTLSGDHTATANSNISLTASAGALTVNATGGVYIYGDSADASAYNYVSAGNIALPALNTVSGNHTATANSNITLSGATSVALNLGVGELYISGSSAVAEAYHSVYGNTNVVSGNYAATANSNISLIAGSGALTVNAAGGVNINGSSASATAYKYVSGSNHTVSGNHAATANSNITLSGTSVTLDLGGGQLYISGSSASASAYHSVYGNTNIVSGNHAATANSDIKLIASSGALTVNATGGVEIYGSSAEASAYKYVNGNNHTVSGNNTATAGSSITLSGASVALNLGSGQLYISGSSAYAGAYHSVYGNTNVVSGDHAATANSNISLIASSGALTVNATGGVSIYGSSADASAYKYVVGNNHTVSGNHAATANSNITLSGSSVALNLGLGTMTISGSSASARAYHQINNGNANILSGVHSATANSNISISATGGNLTIDAGSIAVNGDSASARAYMSVSGNGNTIGIAGAASNTATADATIRFTATANQTITVAGGISASASISASADAYHRINNGTGNNLSGNNTASATNGLTVTAGGTLAIAASSLNVGSIDASTSAYKSIYGASSARADNNQISGNNSATGQGLIKFGGGILNISLTGGLGIFGSYVYARAYNEATNFSDNNTLSGNNTAKAAANIVFEAATTLSIAAGSVTANASSASAHATNTVGGLVTGNNISGANSATADANILISATGGNLTMNVSAGNVLLAGSSADARATNAIDAGNTVTATNAAVAHGNVLAASGGNMTIGVTAGDLTILGNTATALTSGAGTNAADANANAGLFSFGAKTVTASGTVALVGGFTTQTGTGATASAFAMLDPGSLDLTASLLTLTPNTGNVVLSATGPLSLTIGGVPTPVAGLLAPGVIAGEGTLTSSDPITVDIGGTVINVGARFGLPAGFLTPATPPALIIWDGGAGTFNWLDPLNWSTNALPIFSQDVTIGALGTPVTLAGVSTIKSLTSSAGIILSGGTSFLTIANPSTVTNTFSISGGTLTANGSFAANTLNLSAGAINGAGDLVVTSNFNQTGGSVATTGNLNLSRIGDFTVGVFNSPGRSVTLNATGAIIDGNGAADNVTASTLTLNAATGIALNATVATMSVTNTTSGNVTLTNNGAVQLAAVSQGAGSFNLSASGAVTQAGAASVGGASSFNSGANPIALINAGNDFSGAVTLTNSGANDVSIVDSNALQLGALTVGRNLTVTASGAISQTGALVVPGLTTLQAGAANDIVLNLDNNFGSVAINSTNSATIIDVNAVTLNASTVTGNLNVTSANTLTVNGALTGGAVTLTSSAGDIADPAGAAITAGTITLGAMTGVGVIAHPMFVVPTSSAGLGVTNAVSGDIVVTANVPSASGDLTIGTGGASFNNAGTGGYFIAAARDLIINAGASSNRQVFFIGGRDVNIAQPYANNTGLGVAVSAVRDINIGANLTAGLAGGFLSLASSGNVNLTNAVAKSTSASTTVTAANLNVLAASLPTRLEAGTDIIIAVPGSVTVQGGTVANAFAEITNANGAGGVMDLTVGGNIKISGGAGLGAYAQIHGKPDVNLTLTGVTSEIQLTAGPTAVADCAIATNCQYARVWADSPSSIHVDLPKRSGGGFVVNGVVEGIGDPVTRSGFFVGPPGSESIAVLGVNLVVTDAGGGVLPEVITATLNTVISEIKGSTEFDVEEENTANNNDPNSLKEKKKQEEKNKNSCS